MLRAVQCQNLEHDQAPAMLWAIPLLVASMQGCDNPFPDEIREGCWFVDRLLSTLSTQSSNPGLRLHFTRSGPEVTMLFLEEGAFRRGGIPEQGAFQILCDNSGATITCESPLALINLLFPRWRDEPPLQVSEDQVDVSTPVHPSLPEESDNWQSSLSESERFRQFWHSRISPGDHCLFVQYLQGLLGRLRSTPNACQDKSRKAILVLVEHLLREIEGSSALEMVASTEVSPVASSSRMERASQLRRSRFETGSDRWVKLREKIPSTRAESQELLRETIADSIKKTMCESPKTRSSSLGSLPRTSTGSKFVRLLKQLWQRTP